MAQPHTKQTHIYKTVGTTNLYLDIYSPSTKNPTPEPKPVILWFHGGYLITGTRTAIPGWLLTHALTNNYTLISPDYRVLPESRGPAILSDFRSAYEWIITTGASLPTNPPIDTNQIILAGASAGGWCALTTALYFANPSSSPQIEAIALPPPKALFLLYPLLDLANEKWARGFKLPGSEMFEQGTKDLLIEDLPRRIERGEVSVGEAFPSSEEEVRTRKRLPLLYAVMENEVWLDCLTGVEGFGARVVEGGLTGAVDAAAAEVEAANLMELFPLEWGVYGSSFPATVVVHGTADREVSCAESEKLVARLQAEQRKVRYFPVPAADHVFDLGVEECQEQREGEGEEVRVILRRALEALRGFVGEV